MNEKKRTNNTRALAALLLSVFCCVFLFSCLSPLMADDYSYSFSCATGLRIGGLYDIFKSMEIHFESVNSRYFSHLLVYFFRSVDKLAFNLANAVFAACLVLLLYKYINCVNSSAAAGFSAAGCALIFCLAPVFGQTFLWTAGACNYSWGQVFILLYMYPFAQFLLTGEKIRHPIFSLLLVPEAFIAGAYSENASAAAVGITVCILLWLKLNHRKIPVFFILSLISACLGFCLLLYGTFIKTSWRVSGASDGSAFSVLGLFSRIPKKFLIIGVFGLVVTAGVFYILRKDKALLSKVLSAFTAALLLAVCFILRPDFSGCISVRDYVKACFTAPELGVACCGCIYLEALIIGFYREVNRNLMFLAVLFGVAAAGSVLILCLGAYVAARSFLPYTVLLVLAVLLISAGCPAPRNKTVSAVLAVAFGICFTLAVTDILHIHNTDVLRNEAISSAIENNEEASVPRFDPITQYSAAYGLDDVTDDPDDWPNRTMAEYYGVAGIVSAP